MQSRMLRGWNDRVRASFAEKVEDGACASHTEKRGAYGCWLGLRRGFGAWSRVLEGLTLPGQEALHPVQEIQLFERLQHVFVSSQVQPFGHFGLSRACREDDYGDG